MAPESVARALSDLFEYSEELHQFSHRDSDPSNEEVVNVTTLMSFHPKGVLREKCLKDFKFIQTFAIRIPVGFIILFTLAKCFIDIHFLLIEN